MLTEALTIHRLAKAKRLVRASLSSCSWSHPPRSRAISARFLSATGIGVARAPAVSLLIAAGVGARRVDPGPDHQPPPRPSAQDS